MTGGKTNDASPCRFGEEAAGLVLNKKGDGGMDTGDIAVAIFFSIVGLTLIGAVKIHYDHVEKMEVIRRWPTQ